VSPDTAAVARFGVLISGRGSNMVSLVTAAQAGQINARPAIVISNVPDAPGLVRAGELGVETAVVDHRAATTREDHDRRMLEVLRSHDVRLVCLAGYVRLLSAVLVEAFPSSVLNIHPSLLPAFPGLHAQRQALEYGVKRTGCTVHFVDEQLDHGPILLQEVVDVRDDDDEQTLAARILEVEHRLYPEAVRLFFENRVHAEGRRVKIEVSPSP